MRSLDFVTLPTRAPIVVLALDSLQLVAANEPARKLLGLREQQGDDRWLRALLNELPHGVTLSELRRLRFGHVQRGRVKVSSRGSTRLMRVEAHLAQPQDPVVVLELTEVIEDEEAISGVEASAKRFKALLEGIADAYYDWHILTDFVEVTSPLDLMLGLEPGGLPHTNVGFRERIHPDDRYDVVAANERAVATGSPYVGEYRMRCEDQSYVVVEDRGIIIADESGTPTHQVGTIRDVTLERQTEQALRDSRELYRTLFTTAANPAYRLDDKGVLIDANPAGLELLEIQESDLTRVSLESLFARDLLEAVRQALETGVVARREAALHQDDRPRHLLFSIVPCNVGGASTAFLLGTDVTPLFRDLRDALEESEGALRHQAELLEQRSRALSAALKRMHDDDYELEQNVMRNLEQFVLPTIERTRVSLGLRPEAAQLDALAHALRDIGRPLLGLAMGKRPNGQPTGEGVLFTRRETEVMSLIRAGRTTAEIAEALYLSPATVTYHRRNIRRKLGLEKGEPRLDTYLLGGRAAIEPAAERDLSSTRDGS